MSYDLSDPGLSAALVERIRAMIRDEVAALVPREQYGVVAAVDLGLRRASVYLDGSPLPSPGWVYPAEAVPVAGDRVLVRRTADGDRLILLNLTGAADHVIPSNYVEEATPATTVSATLEDIPGLTTTLTLRVPTEITGFFNAHVSADGICTLGLGIAFDGEDHEEVSVYLDGASDAGTATIIHRSELLQPGTHTITGRMRRVSGGPKIPGVDHADLLVMAMATHRAGR